MKPLSAMHQDLASDWDHIFAKLVVGVAVTIAALGLWVPPASAVTIAVTNACDLLVVPPGEGLGAGTLEAAPGDTVQLTADSFCDPEFDPLTGDLLSGDGIAIEADEVILDLNGFDIISLENVAADGEAAGFDVENAGVAVGAKNVTVTNSSAAVSVVSNFTANFDYAKAESSSLVGMLSGGVFNIHIGESHGGGGIAVDRSRAITIDTVEIVDQQPGEAPVGGDNGIDWKRCSGPGNVLKNSSIKAPLSGLRFRNCKGGGMLTIHNTSFSTVDALIGVGIEFTRDVEGVTLTGNDIGPNGEIGVVVGGNTKSILFNPLGTSPNTIHDNAICGIEFAPTAQNMQTNAQLLANNTFLGNGANICR